MASYTTIRSPSAIAVGLFFTLVTAYVLLEDVARHGAPITTKHVMTLAVLAGTIYFGHRWWIELKAWRLGTMLGCTLLFLSGTATCVIMSAGRNAEATTNKALTANSVNMGRASAQKDRDEAKPRYLAALKAEEAECNSGDGLKCQAKRITRKLRREEYDTAEARLRAERPEQIANADIRASAELFARLPYVTTEAPRIEALLLLTFPFLQSLFCEIGAICGFAIGLGHKALPGAKADLPEARASVSRRLETVSGNCFHRKPTQICSSDDDVLQALKGARRPVSNDELADLMGVTKGEASKRVAALNGTVHKVRVGRFVMISLTPETVAGNSETV